MTCDEQRLLTYILDAPLSADQSVIERLLQALSLALKINNYHISYIRDFTCWQGYVYVKSRDTHQAVELIFSSDT